MSTLSSTSSCSAPREADFIGHFGSGLEIYLACWPNLSTSWPTRCLFLFAPHSILRSLPGYLVSMLDWRRSMVTRLKTLLTFSLNASSARTLCSLGRVGEFKASVNLSTPGLRIHPREATLWETKGRTGQDG